MATITFRLSEEEKGLIEKVSKFDNVSISDFARKALIEAAEDYMDIQTYNKLMKEHEENDQSISHEQMKAELGL
ncbi:MAG TPA: toxin-antitoxin system antitoxin subunit [Candidatus Tetragenococcus pullicola]|nr:toxin-antitoxin system antitoxin subunit [Candidatus Tetragenococcus pullicola]